MIYYELSLSQLEAKANELIEKHDRERLLKVKPIDVYDMAEIEKAVKKERKLLPM